MKQYGPSIGHDVRYRLAAGYAYGDDVLDAACGLGYGATLLPYGTYTGVDINLGRVQDEYRNVPRATWIEADLMNWMPLRDYDVACCFETLEHVTEPDKLVQTLCACTNEVILASVPIIPTAGANPEHLHDFTMFDLPRMFQWRGWELEQFLIQPSELSGVFVFRPA